MQIKIRYIFLHPLCIFIIFLIIFIAYYASIQLNIIPFKFSIIILILLLFSISITVFALIRRNIILALNAVIPFLVFLTILFNRSAVIQIIFRGELALYAKKYAECANRALSSHSEIHLEVCDAWDQPSLQFTESIIYDESDQIEITDGRQSNNWVERAILFERIIPIRIMGFTARRIEGHFFYVYFLYTEPPKINLGHGKSDSE